MQQNFTFTVVTTNSLADPPLNNTAQVFVSVVDVNDNTPSFSKPVYRVSVSELLPQGTTVITVSASDLDIVSHFACKHLVHDSDRLFREIVVNCCLLSLMEIIPSSSSSSSSPVQKRTI